MWLSGEIGQKGGQRATKMKFSRRPCWRLMTLNALVQAGCRQGESRRVLWCNPAKDSSSPVFVPWVSPSLPRPGSLGRFVLVSARSKFGWWWSGVWALPL